MSWACRVRTLPALSVIALLHCGGEQQAAVLPGQEACGVNDRLTQRAIDAANAADQKPDDPALLRQAVLAARALGAHKQAHHAQDLVGDQRGAIALTPSLKRALAAAPDCESKRDIARIDITLDLYDEGAAVLLRDARACITGIDAATTCKLSRTSDADARALIAEVWPRAAPGEQLPMLDAIANCSDMGELEANLSFVSPEVRATYLALVKARELHQELVEAQRRLVEECHTNCLDLYGEGSSLCARACTDIPGCMDTCIELGGRCHARCGP